jgi:hypothetical protein
MRPILLFLQATASVSSPPDTARPRILTPLVELGHHLLIKSYGYFPDVELFSSDLTHIAIYPFSEAIKNPLEKGLKHEICIKLSSELKAFSTYYFIS